MKKLLCIASVLIMGCFPNTTLAQELIKDSSFDNGFRVKDRNNPSQFLGNLQLPGTTVTPTWSLAEWYSQSTLYGHNATNVSDGGKKWANSYKALTIYPGDSAESDIKMALNAHSEFNGVYRSSGDPWPHLLVEQRLHVNGNPSVAEMDELRLDFDAQLLYRDPKTGSGFDANIHAAQYVMFYSVQNLNQSNPGYGDFLWFGIPIYDNRYQMVPSRVGVDGALANKPGTGKLIYRLASNDLTNNSMHSRQWVNFNADLLPHVRDALQEAWSRGFLTDSMNYEDYYIGGMNMGWEITGLDVATVRVKDLSLKVFSADLPRGYEFNQHQDREGWSFSNLNEQFNGPKDGRWFFSTPQSDPKLISPALNINGNRVKKVVMRMANNVNVSDAQYIQMFWKRSDQPYYSESKSKKVTITNDGGGWLEYTIDMSSHPNWHGNITSLRIDPVRYGDGRWIGIDYIRFE